MVIFELLEQVVHLGDFGLDIDLQFFKSVNWELSADFETKLRAILVPWLRLNIFP